MARYKKGISGNPNVRPPKYKPEYNKIVYEMCKKNGYTDKQLANLLSVNPDTITEWKKVYPEFSVSLKSGKDEFDTEVVEKTLLKRASGYTYIEQKKRLTGP